MSANPDPANRQPIIAATLRLIGQQGCDGLSQIRVGDAMGLSRDEIGAHFPSRDALLVEAFRLYMQEFDVRLARCLGQAVQAGGGDPVDTVSGFLTLLLKDELADPDMLRAELELVSYSANHRELAEEFAMWDQGMAAPLTDYLAGGGFRQPEQLASVLMRMMRGIEVQALIHATPDVEEFRAQLIQVLRAYQDQPGV